MVHKAARQRLLDENSSFQRVLLPLLEGWLNGDEPAAAPPSARHARWHELLDTILDSGDRDQVQIIQQQLQICARMLSAAAPVAGKQKKAG